MPSWVKVKANNGKAIKALTFVIRRNHPSFAAPMPDEDSVKIIAEAKGSIGSNSDYLFNTEEALNAEGIKDNKLKKLSAMVKQYQKR